MGYSKPYSSSSIEFRSFKELKLSFDSAPVFCADGERVDNLDPSFFVKTHTLHYSVKIGLPE